MVSKCSVLIIDDSQIILERLVPEIKELAQVNNVVVGNSFDEGQELIQSSSFDIVILDINLNDKSGIDLLRYLKSINKYTKVIMMTVDDSEEKKQACLALGANFFLNKFIDLERLPDIIKNMF